MRRLEPLSRLLAGALSVLLATQAAAGPIERSALPRAAADAKPVKPLVGGGPVAISGTFGSDFGAVRSLIVNGTPVVRGGVNVAPIPLAAAAVEPIEAAPAGPGTSGGQGPLAAAGGNLEASPREVLGAARDRVSGALDRAKSLLMPGKGDDGGWFRIDLKRPKAEESATAEATTPPLPPASKLVSELSVLLKSDRQAAIKEAARRLVDPKDKRVEVRADAARLLIENGRPGMGRFLAFAASRNKNWHVLRELAFGLGLRAIPDAMAKERVVRTLQKLLAHENDSVHLMAHWALRQHDVDPGAERQLKPDEVHFTPPLTAWQKAWPLIKWGAISALTLGAILAWLHFIIQHPGAAPVPDGVTGNVVPSEGGELASAVAGTPSGPAATASPATAVPAPPSTQQSLAEIVILLRVIALNLSQGGSSFLNTFLSMIVTGIILTVGISVAPKVIEWFKKMQAKTNANHQAQTEKYESMSNDPNYQRPGQKLSFDEIAGVDEARDQLMDIVDFVKNPKKYSKRNAKIPRGVLLVGPPGTGKTLLAETVASQADVPVFKMSGSEFVEMYVGVGAKRVRELFAKAKASGKGIIFIDEIDAIARKRSGAGANSNDERESTLNQLLVEMTEIQKAAADQGIIVIGATNRLDVLDDAILRPGRFDSHIEVGLPDVIGREAILAVHASNRRLAPDADIKHIAQRATGLSGAFLAGLINHADLHSIKHGRAAITAEDLDYGFTKVTIGDKRHKLMDPQDKETIADHEAGHLVTGRRVAKLTIVPHGRALGYAEPVEEMDKYLQDEDYLKDQLVVLMGGRAAEMITRSKGSSGADNDFERATNIAYHMVGRWGMGKGTGYGQTFGGHENPQAGPPVSDLTKREVDLEVRNLLNEAMAEAIRRIEAKRPQFDQLRKELLERETLYQSDIDRIMGGAAPPAKPAPPAAPAQP